MFRQVFASGAVLFACLSAGCDDTADALKQEAREADATLDRASAKAQEEARAAKRELKETAVEVERDVREAAGEARRDLSTATDDAKHAVDRADKAVAEQIRE